MGSIHVVKTIEDKYQRMLNVIVTYYKQYGTYPNRRDIPMIATDIYRKHFRTYGIANLSDAMHHVHDLGLIKEPFIKTPRLDFSTKTKTKQLLENLRKEIGRLTTRDILTKFTGLSRIIFVENRWGVHNVYELCKLLEIPLDGTVRNKYKGKQGFDVIFAEIKEFFEKHGYPPSTHEISQTYLVYLKDYPIPQIIKTHNQFLEFLGLKPRMDVSHRKSQNSVNSVNSVNRVQRWKQAVEKSVEFALIHDFLIRQIDDKSLAVFAQQNGGSKQLLEDTMEVLRSQNILSVGVINSYKERMRFFTNRSGDDSKSANQSKRKTKRPMGIRKYLSKDDIVKRLQQFIVERQQAPSLKMNRMEYTDCRYLGENWFDLVMDALLNIKAKGQLHEQVLMQMQNRSTNGLWKTYFENHKLIFNQLFEDQ